MSPALVTPEITPLIQRLTEIFIQSCGWVQANHLPDDRMCHRYCTTACGNNMASSCNTQESGIVDSNLLMLNQRVSKYLQSSFNLISNSFLIDELKQHRGKYWPQCLQLLYKTTWTVILKCWLSLWTCYISSLKTAAVVLSAVVYHYRGWCVFKNTNL